MGDIADAMLDGTLCECCGTYLDGGPQGFPGYCSPECAQGRGVRCDEPPPAKPPRPFRCSKNCGRRFATAAALAQHRRDKHKL